MPDPTNKPVTVLAIGPRMIHRLELNVYSLTSVASFDAAGALLPGQYTVHADLDSALLELFRQALTDHDETALVLCRLVTQAHATGQHIQRQFEAALHTVAVVN